MPDPSFTDRAPIEGRSTSRLRASLQRELNELADQDLRRSFRRVERREGARILVDGRPAVDFSSNDYLGLAGHPEIVRAVQAALKLDALGAGASRNLSGNHPRHEALEERLARWKGAEASLLFTSGYAANVGTIPALAGTGSVVYSDALNHASIIDGCRLSRAEVRIFPHLDLTALADMLERDRGAFDRRIIVVEGVYSMDGDLFPLDRLVPIAREHGAWIYVDDAHGTGVLGESGAGSAEHWGVASEIDITLGTLGKALGVSGAFVAGPRVLRELLLNRARSSLFTTAPPSAIAAGASAAVEIARAESWRRERLRENADRLAAGLAELGLVPMGEPAGHIVPVVLGDARSTMEVSRHLLDRGYLVGGIRPPTVPAGAARLRISLSAAHTPGEIAGLLAVLGDLLPKLPLPGRTATPPASASLAGTRSA